jgi:hypothetical protein
MDYTTTLCGKWQEVKNFALVLFGELRKLPAAKPNDPDGMIEDGNITGYKVGFSRAACPRPSQR